MARHETIEVSPEIFGKLRKLRRSIRRYVVLEGTALVVVLLSALFWFSLGLDWAYFQVRSLELPVWFRQAFAVVTICLFVFGCAAWIALRLLRSMRMKALALVLERRFPELDDRLITAVEFVDSRSQDEPGLTSAMLRRTIDDAARAVESIELGSVFDKKPLHRAVLAALVLVTSIAAFAWVNQQAMARWTRAFVNWDDEYWNRDTQLRVRVIAQPNDVIREFRDNVYKHPRGGDFTLLVDVPEGNEVPDRVELDYRLAGGRGDGRVFLSKFGDREFKHTLVGVLDSLEFWVSGGDFVNRLPYEVIVVDPPRIDQIDFENDYPDYTDLDPVDSEGRRTRHEQTVRGAQISIPMETQFLFRARTNKPLVGVRIETDSFEVQLSEGVSRLSVLSADRDVLTTKSLPMSPGRPWFAAGSRSFVLPFVLSANAVESLKESLPNVPIPLPADSLMRIYLEDTDGVVSIEPARLTVNGIVDEPPLVETELTGIGSAITRKAVIPVQGKITDDYGVVEARFEYRIDGSDAWQPRSLRSEPEGRPTEFQLARSGDHTFEQFDVVPLELEEGQKLTVTVFAADGDNLNGPHSSRGERFGFQIVSREELLSILYGKELNLRKRFEQIITEVEDLQQDLILHRSRLQEAAELSSQPANADTDAQQQVDEIDISVGVAAERALHQVRKNANETAAIEESFEEILEELVNNAVHTRQMVDRIEGLIIVPLTEINTGDFPRVDERIGLVKLAHEQGNDPTEQIDATLDALGTMLARMRQVLDEMQDLVDFHSAVNQLKTIIDEQQKLGEETQRQQKKSLIDKLKGFDLQ